MRRSPWGSITCRRSSPLTLNDKVRASLLARHADEHNAGHLYDLAAERMQHQGYEGFAHQFRTAAAEERGEHAQRVEDILHAFDIDPHHAAVDEPDLSSYDSALDLLYLAWETEAGLLRRYEETKALAADADELAVESPWMPSSSRSFTRWRRPALFTAAVSPLCVMAPAS